MLSLGLTRLSSLAVCLSRKVAYAERIATSLHSAAIDLDRHRDRRDLVRTQPKKDEGSSGETRTDIRPQQESCYRLPDENTPFELYDGVMFSELPILHIKVSKNNTLMTLTTHDGKILVRRSCGTEGFKHCRKGTTVAAQTTGLAMANRIHKAGLKNVRVVIKGLGPGRMSSVKGLVDGGINIVSITDDSPYLEFPLRPPAAKSI